MNNHFKAYNLSTFFRLLIFPCMFLLFFEASGQTTFTVTNKVMGGVGSFDVILASALPSANAGNNVTIFFNVAPDATGNSLCTISSLLPDVSPTAGSIFLTKAAGVTNKQGLEFEDNLAFQKIFHAGGKLVRMSHLVIIKKKSQTLSQVGYSELKKAKSAGYATAVEGKVKFTFDEEYKIASTKFLTFKFYNDNHQLLASSTIDGVVTGGATALPYVFDDNRYTMNLASITNIVIGKYYTLEVLTSTGEKLFLRILYKS